MGGLPLHADFQLELVGTESLSIVPMGSDTQVQLTSNWPHPSFGGQFLPVERKVTNKGFEASWRVSALASTAQQDVTQSPEGEKSKPAPACAVAAGAPTSSDCTEAFGVTFVDPSDTYALSDKATKYGMLFIGLTFLAVGLFEFMKSLRVHPIQYLLVGAAMSMFFLLLVSLSEHMPFGLGIATLYGMLFVLLRMEQTALLVGAVALFAVLAVIMLLTRRIDWYARLHQADAAAMKGA